MGGLIETIFSIEFIVTAISAVAAFATILSIGLPYVEGDRLQARMKAVSTEREAMRAKQREALGSKEKDRRLRQTPGGFMKRTIDQLKLQNLLESSEVKAKLAQAGVRGQAPVVTFIFFRFASPIVMFALALLYLFFLNDFGLGGMGRVAASVAAALFGYYLPDLIVQNMITRRQEAVQMAFPDTLDLLLICVESGMSIEAAFNKVAAEIGTQSVEMAEELSLTTAELSYLQERRNAFDNFATRTGLDSVKAVTTSLAQAEKYGTPLGQALRVMAKENRMTRMMAAEKKAASLPPKLTVPMILFFLPVLFVIILGPAAIELMQNF